LFRNSVRRFGWIARALHWTTVALVAIVFIDISGLDAPPKVSQRDAVVAFHVSLGLVVFVIMLGRLGWRMTNPNPVRSWNLSPGHRLLAITVHRLMYVVVIGLCLCGIAGVLTGGAALEVFGLSLVEPGVAVHATANAVALDLHDRLSILLLAMIAVHATTAIVNLVFAGNDPAAG
jgi:cytochrome b561